MLRFCTLLDTNYLAKGFCLYESLKQVTEEFHLYIFTFDKRSSTLLQELNLKKASVVSLDEFENDELRSVKKDRTPGEYYWTSKATIIFYCLTKFNLDHCTYIDADLYFYNDPHVLFKEIDRYNVIITSHNYSPFYDQSKTSGKYCAQWLSFRNSSDSLIILDWWKNACISWCYYKVEEGKFADQKYLDDWTQRFEGVHVIQHPGAGVAPWNMQKIDVCKKSGYLRATEITTGRKFPVIFFHFHNVTNLRLKYVDEWVLGHYRIPKSVKDLIYRPYLRELEKADKILRKMDDTTDYLGTRHMDFPFVRWLMHLIRNVFRQNKVFHLTKWL